MTWRTRPVGESSGHPSAPKAAPASDAVSADARSEELLTGPARCSELQAGKAASSARLNFGPEFTALPSWALPDSTQTTLRKRIDDRSDTSSTAHPADGYPYLGAHQAVHAELSAGAISAALAPWIRPPLRRRRDQRP